MNASGKQRERERAYTCVCVCGCVCVDPTAENVVVMPRLTMGYQRKFDSMSNPMVDVVLPPRPSICDRIR